MAFFRRPRNSRTAATSVGFQRFTSLFVLLGLLVGLFAAFVTTQTAIHAAPQTLPNATVGKAYLIDLDFCSGGGSCTATVTGGAVPAGMSVTVAGGIFVNFGGTPTTAGTYPFQVTVNDNGATRVIDNIITVDPAGTCNGPCFASSPKPGQVLVIRARVGKPGVNSILVSNTGTGQLIVDIGIIGGTNATDFKVVSTAGFLDIAGGASQSIVIQCNPSAPGKRTATISLFTQNGIYDYPLVCTDVEEEKLPADLMLQLRGTPDRQAKIGPETEIVYDLKVTNVGPGVGDAVRLLFPIDPNLTPAYTRFSDGRMWVSEKVTDGDKPYLKIAMPSVQPGQSFSATLVFHPKAGAKVGAVVREQFTSGWDDQVHAGMTTTSNAVMVTLTDSNSNRDDTRGKVMWFPQHGQSVELNKSLILTADFYAPNEGVDFWYTDADNNSVQLGMFWADQNGKLKLEFSTKGLTGGKTYTIVGKGRRSDIMGSAAITVTAVKASNYNPPKDPKKTK